MLPPRPEGLSLFDREGFNGVQMTIVTGEGA